MKNKVAYKRNINLDVIGTKIPPYSLDAEIAVLGSMMLDSQAIVKCQVLLTPDMFYIEAHKRIYETMLDMNYRNISVDIVTLREEFKKRDCLEFIGGIVYLTEINANTPTAANVESHAAIIRERHIKRELIQAASKILTTCYDETTDAFEEFDCAMVEMERIGNLRITEDIDSPKELAHITYDYLERLMSQKLIGIQSPFGSEFQKLTGDFFGGDFIICAGRPSMGKTAFALTWLEYLAYKKGIPCGLISLEMTKIQNMLRLISSATSISMKLLRSGRVKEGIETASDKTEAMKKIVEFLGIHRQNKLIIEHSFNLNVTNLQARIKRMINTYGIKFLVVDYLQLAKSNSKSESRERDIADISRALKSVANEYDIVVLALAQLNRDCEQRRDKRPALSDLRESGALEQDADYVFLLYRPEEYGFEQIKVGKNSDAKTIDTQGIAELIVAKGRNTGTGNVLLKFIKHYTKFLPLETEKTTYVYSDQSYLVNDNDDVPF